MILDLFRTDRKGADLRKAWIDKTLVFLEQIFKHYSMVLYVRYVSMYYKK